MVIDEKFYVGRAKDRQIIRMVRGIKYFHKVRYVPGVFVVTLPLFGDGILEIYEMNEFRQKIYRDMSDSIHIVGAAATRAQAISLVRDIIDDIYKKTGGVDVKEFFHAEG